MDETTIAILTDDGKMCCDACGCEIKEDDTECSCCHRTIDWDK